MKKIYSLILIPALAMGFMILAAPMAAQDNEQDVNVIEHLGDTIPLQLTFTNESGKTVQLKELITKPTILIPVFFTCPGICPEILSAVSDAIERSDMTLGKEYRIVTFSFDPTDTPEGAVEKKKTYLRKRSLPHAADWIYLTGDSANIMTLTNAIGYHYQQAGNGFLHPAAIIILSPAGKITRYLYGTYFLPFDLKMAIVEASKGEARPTINRVLEYCFSYDPEGRKYTLQVTKISATIIIFFALILFIYLLVRSSKKKKGAGPVEPAA